MKAFRCKFHFGVNSKSLAHCSSHVDVNYTAFLPCTMDAHATCTPYLNNHHKTSRTASFSYSDTLVYNPIEVIDRPICINKQQ